MATRNFLISKDALVASFSGSKGAGQDDHLPVGVSGGATLRSLLQFTLNWTGVYGITKAELKIVTSPSNYHGVKTTDPIYVRRNTSSWSEGTRGSDEVWYADNAVEWDNKPSTTTTGQASHTPSSSNSSTRTIDITNIVKAWAPTSIPGGGGASNYGITLLQQSEASGNYTEFQSREGGTDAYILLTYVDTPPQTDPVATKVSPPSGGLARIANVADVVDLSSFAAKPEFKFTYTDAEGHACSRWVVRIYSAATEGTLLYEYDAGTLATKPATGSTITHVVPNASAGVGPTWTPDENTSYWWTVQVYDDYSTPGDSGESSRTEWKVRYGHAIFSEDAGDGAHTLSDSIVPVSAAANTQRKRLYRLWNGTSGYTDWVESLGALPTPLATPYTYVQTMVRLASDLAGVNPSIDSYALQYFTDTAALPDKWGYSANSSLFVLDTDNRRYGAKSLKGTNIPSTTRIFPKRQVAGDDDIPVTPNTEYVFVCEVKTDSYLAGDQTIALVVYEEGGTTVPITIEPTIQSATGTASTDLINDVGHGLAAETPIRITGLAGGTGLDTGITYYVISDGLTADAFKVSLELNGEAVDITDDYSSIEYRRAFLGAEWETHGTYDPDGVALGPEGWVRLRLPFNSGDHERIRPAILFVSDGSSTPSFWLDGAALTEGSVAPSWAQGTVSSAGVISSSGVQIDAQQGGVVRLHGSDSDSRSVVELGTTGLVFGGDVEVSSPSAGVLAVDGTIDGALATTVTGGKPPVRRVYTPSGSPHTWTKPAGLSHIEVECVGGGGGGGGTDTTGTGEYAAGGGGGGGGYARKLYTAAQLPSSVEVTVGSGGGSASAGGASYFLSAAQASAASLDRLTANGGGAGEQGDDIATSSALSSSGGAGGTASGGDINVTGGDGPNGRGIGGSLIGPTMGGTSFFTGSARGGFTGAGGDGDTPGGGGGGATALASASARSGGTGGAGVVIVTEYYLG